MLLVNSYKKKSLLLKTQTFIPEPYACHNRNCFIIVVFDAVPVNLDAFWTTLIAGRAFLDFSERKKINLEKKRKSPCKAFVPKFGYHMDWPDSGEGFSKRFKTCNI